MVACCRLLRAVGRAVATHHVGRRVSEQVLHVEFAGIVCDGPRRECVAEAMRVDFRHFCATTEAAEHLLEPVRVGARSLASAHQGGWPLRRADPEPFPAARGSAPARRHSALQRAPRAACCPCGGVRAAGASRGRGHRASAERALRAVAGPVSSKHSTIARSRSPSAVAESHPAIGCAMSAGENGSTMRCGSRTFLIPRNGLSWRWRASTSQLKKHADLAMK